MLFNATRKRHFEKTTQLSLVRLILSLGFAGFETVLAIYMASFGLSESNVGFISAILVILTLIFSFYSTIILEKFNEVKILFVSIGLVALSFGVIAFTDSLWIFLILLLIISICQVLRGESFSILFRDNTDDKKLESSQGLLFSLLNIGWVLGPLIAGFILLDFGASNVFLASSGFLIFGLFILRQVDLKSKKKDRKEIDSNILKNLKSYFSQKRLILPYFISAGLEFWWALIYIYIPLFIVKNGFSEGVVGFFLAAVVVPLIMFEFEVGKHCKKYGFRKLFFLGFFTLGIFSSIIFFVNDFLIVLGLLVLASAPVALIEPIQNSFFFRQVSSKEEEKFYPIYITSEHIGSFISKFLIASLLLFLPEKFIYLLMAVFMFGLSFVSLKIS